MPVILDQSWSKETLGYNYIPIIHAQYRRDRGNNRRRH
jgi:hypothetical protein